VTTENQSSARLVSGGVIWLSVLALLCIDQFTVRSSGMNWSDFLSWRYWANQIISALFLFGLLVLLGSYLGSLLRAGRTRLFWLALIINAIEVACLYALQVNHFLNYEKPFSSFGVRFVFENPWLFLELAGENLQIFQTLLRVLPSALLFAFVLHAFAGSARVSMVRVGSAGLSLLAALGVATFAWASSPTMQHSLLSASAAFMDLLRMPNNFYKADVPGKRQFDSLQCTQPVAGRVPASVIWVVGESLVAKRMSLYGYSRPTTDFLLQEWQQDRLVRFNNAVSIGTVTRISLPYLFFGIQGPDSDGRIYRTPSVFDFAKAVGLKTAFIGAQELRWGDQDKIIINHNVDLYRSGTDFDRSAGVSKGAEDFKVLNEGALPFLNNIQEPFFLALHMDGSHYPYATHSLPRHKRFLPELSANDDNAYDNTVVQLDAYMRELMSVVRARHPQAWVFYSSDHGQNLSKEVRFNSGYSDNVIRNPLFVLPPAGQLEKLEQNSGSPVSQADLYATTLALWGCSLPEHLRQDSLSLFGKVPSNRIRVVSGLMTSHFVDETVAVVLPDRKKIEIDYAKGAVTFHNGQVVPLSSWNSAARRFVERFEKSADLSGESKR
jgi:glucan phosphoethanolaminetransferase (alkaline phosphatase superfamily)